MQKIIHFFDKVEDHVRDFLSHHPFLYAGIGATAIVLFWRGVWMIADDLGVNGVWSVVISVVVLLVTGLFVSFFIGDRIILSGWRHEKKLAERMAVGVKTDTDILLDIHTRVQKLEKDLEELKRR